ncbi:MAG: class IV adenylate cyclase [Firmicutes bacterium]|nr:class IV adenylate cyclase [Bacillota bacterium]
MESHRGVETEIKLKIADLAEMQERLHALGFVLRVPSSLERSVLWDREEALMREGCALRLRRYAERAWLTWKGAKVPDALLKIRPEWETEIADPEAMEKILEGLGYAPVLTMEKHRAMLEGNQLSACLDFTPFGAFLELEGEAEAIQRTMAALGLGAEAVERRSYPTLFREAVSGKT